MNTIQGKFMQITQEIFQVGGDRFTSSEDAAVYLINFNGHAALVDTGCGHVQTKLLANIEACGVDLNRIEYLLVTHCHYDHTGGVKALKDLVPGQVVAHELEAPFLEQGDNVVTAAQWYGAKIHPFSVDHKIRGVGEELLLGDRVIQALHTPGHSPGSMVYVAESGGLKVLFGQDVHGPIHPDLKSDAAAYQRSLHLLLSLKADILCEGHYGVFKGQGEVEKFIKRFLA
jgi:glyoxylase-like metal-dependent hydrolase (beta-lactamase superfamily II)